MNRKLYAPIIPNQKDVVYVFEANNYTDAYRKYQKHYDQPIYKLHELSEEAEVLFLLNDPLKLKHPTTNIYRVTGALQVSSVFS